MVFTRKVTVAVESYFGDTDLQTWWGSNQGHTIPRESGTLKNIDSSQSKLK